MFRIAAVSYLNTRPLIEGLRNHPSVELILDLPSKLATLLEEDAADAALVPIVDYLSHPDWKLVGRTCIASDGPVLSVMVFSKVPFSQIKTLAADEGSHTSIALTRLLFARRWGWEPKIVPLPMDQDPAKSMADAVLVIGNRALSAEMVQHPFSWDLGLEWKKESGLPMVYAVWAAKNENLIEPLNEILGESIALGLRHTARIAQEGSRELHLNGVLCRRYLEQIIHYELGPREYQAMDRFSQWAQSFGILPNGCEKNHALLCA